MTPLTALLETSEGGELKSEDTVAAVQSAMYFLGNSHQHMNQERRKKVLINLNPALKSMAMMRRSSKQQHPCCLAINLWLKQHGTDRVEQLKAITKMTTKPEQKKSDSRFFGYHPETTLRMATGVQAEMAEDGISHIRGTTDQDQATKDRKTNFVIKFKLCTNNYTCNFSAYRAQSVHAREMVALNKEGYNSPATCRTHQEFHRELVTGNTRPLGPSGDSRLSATSGGSSNSDPNPTRVEVPNGSDRIDHCRGIQILRQRCHQFSSG